MFFNNVTQNVLDFANSIDSYVKSVHYAGTICDKFLYRIKCIDDAHLWISCDFNGGNCEEILENHLIFMGVKFTDRKLHQTI